MEEKQPSLSHELDETKRKLDQIRTSGLGDAVVPTLKFCSFHHNFSFLFFIKK